MTPTRDMHVQLCKIVRHSPKHPNTDVITARLSERFKTVEALAQATPAELAAVPGMGATNAAAVLAAIQLGQASVVCDRPRGADMSDSKTAAAEIRRYVTDRRRECFICLMLDSRNRLIEAVKVTSGTLDTTLAHPREVFQVAIALNAAGIIVGHNHPSGDATPSDDDIRLTRRLAESGKILGIRLVDHVVVVDGAHYSFRAHALV